MRVVKRNGRHESVSFDKILHKNTSLTATTAALEKIDPTTPFAGMIRQLSPLDEVDPTFVTQQTIRGIYDMVSTQELDVYSASVAQSLSLTNPQYSTLAGRIMASNLQKNIECHLSIHFGVPDSTITSSLYLYVTRALWQNKNVGGVHSPLIAPYYMATVEKNAEWLESVFNYSRDFNIDYMGYSILESTYLFKTLLRGSDGEFYRTVCEQPQHMYMRVALGIECSPCDPTGPKRDEIEQKIINMLASDAGVDHKSIISSLGPFLENVVMSNVKENAQQIYESLMQDPGACVLTQAQRENIERTYNMMSLKLGTHATPTLYNAGTISPQCSSCYLLPPPEDSMEGITSSWRSEAMISKWAGGIGSIAYSLRPQGSYIAGTNGSSNGIVPNLKVHNDIAVYVDQCFESDTIVYTLRGPKRVADVKSLDSILTSDSTYHPVTAVREYEYQRESHGHLVQITGKYSEPTIVTSAHPILVLDTTLHLDPQTSLADRRVKAEFVPAGDVHKKHMLVYPIPTTVIDNQLITPELAYKMGLMGEYGKELIHLPIDKIRSYLIGLLEIRVRIRDNISAEIRSELVPYLRYMCLRIGVPIMTYLPLPDETTMVIFPPDYEILRLLPLGQIYNGDTVSGYFVSDGNIYTEISEITSVVPQDVKLYDFDVMTRHDFVTQVGIAHNGGGKRPGSNAVYCTPWHGDIMSFLQLRKERGVESERARDLFYAMWIQDEFMRAVVHDKEWYLMCPNQCPGLYEVYDQKYSSHWLEDGDVNPQDYAFTSLYRQYVSQRKYIRSIPAKDIFNAILDLQIETGLPYMLYSDAANRKCNQKHSGVVHSSNLCTEIMEITSKDETAVCNLASICLNAFVNGGVFDFGKLREVVRTQVYNLNRIIDLNFYPTTSTRRSNLRHRPMGIGVQGLADMFVMMRIPFDSQEAREINFRIFEHIYYNALEMSCELAQRDGVYPSYSGSPASQGVLQFDMWLSENAKAESETGESVLSFPLSLDWNGLKQKISLNGLRNSLFLAPMPTASTAGIMGNSPCFEPFNSLIYKRRIKDGEFVIINKSLIEDLIKLQLWDSTMRDEILLRGGSIQEITSIPKHIRDLYKTSWDISPKSILILALDRAVFIDQSQSMNLFIPAPNTRSLSQVHMYGWRRGIKTGSYYIWGRSPIDAQKIQIDKGVGKMLNAVPKSPQKSSQAPAPAPVEGAVCTREAGCMSCGS